MRGLCLVGVLLAVASAAAGKDLVRVDVSCSVDAIAPGETVMLGVKFVIEPKWHIYWRNAGDTGAPTELSVHAPKGFVVGSVVWPRPRVFSEHGDVSFGYERTATLLVPVTAPATIDVETVTFDVATEWLVCKGVCKFGEHSTSVRLKVGVEPALSSRRGEWFAEALKRMPKPLAKLKGAKVTLNGTTLRVEGPIDLLDRVAFFPAHTPGVRYDGAMPFLGVIANGRFQIEIPHEISPDDALGKPLRAAGLLVFGGADGDPAYDVVVSISPASRP